MRGDGPVFWACRIRVRMCRRRSGHGSTSCGRGLADTDWNIHKLYDGLLAGATVVRATFHRYVIDANRDPSGERFIPGRTPPGWCR